MSETCFENPRRALLEPLLQLEQRAKVLELSGLVPIAPHQQLPVGGTPEARSHGMITVASRQRAMTLRSRASLLEQHKTVASCHTRWINGGEPSTSRAPTASTTRCPTC